MPVARNNRASARVNEIKLGNVEFAKEDIDGGYINPSEILKHINTLTTWASEGSNGALNGKIYSFEYVGVDVNPSVSF